MASCRNYSSVRNYEQSSGGRRDRITRGNGPSCRSICRTNCYRAVRGVVEFNKFIAWSSGAAEAKLADDQSSLKRAWWRRHQWRCDEVHRHRIEMEIIHRRFDFVEVSVAFS